MTFEILKLREHGGLPDRAAAWFHEKWGVPLEAYRESMAQCVERGGPVPQWYVAMDGGKITGGLGVIENDFPMWSLPAVCAGAEKCRRRHLCQRLHILSLDIRYRQFYDIKTFGAVK